MNPLLPIGMLAGGAALYLLFKPKVSETEADIVPRAEPAEPSLVPLPPAPPPAFTPPPQPYVGPGDPLPPGDWRGTQEGILRETTPGTPLTNDPKPPTAAEVAAMPTTTEAEQLAQLLAMTQVRV